MRERALLDLLLVFVPFSLVSIGGGTAIFAGIQHESVDVRHWMTAREFVDAFAIARAAPGPGSMLVTLIGWHVAGLLGAVVATVALYAPSSILCYGVMRVWSRYRGRTWHTALEAGLAPVGAGLMMAGVIAIFRVAGAGPLSWACAGISAAILMMRPRLHPLLLFTAAALAFAAIP